MQETENNAAPEQQVEVEQLVAAQPETTADRAKKLPSPEKMAERAHKLREQQFTNAADAERMAIAKRKKLVDVDGHPTASAKAIIKRIKMSELIKPSDLRKLVPLEGDTMHYVKVATDRHGSLAFPKPHGRRRPHMSRHAHLVKNTAIGIFQGLFKTRVAAEEAAAKEKGEQFHGIANSELPKIGARASTLAMRRVQSRVRAERNRRNTGQLLSRHINRGLLPGNTNRRAYGA